MKQRENLFLFLLPRPPGCEFVLPFQKVSWNILASFALYEFVSTTTLFQKPWKHSSLQQTKNYQPPSPRVPQQISNNILVDSQYHVLHLCVPQHFGFSLRPWHQCQSHLELSWHHLWQGYCYQVIFSSEEVEALQNMMGQLQKMCCLPYTWYCLSVFCGAVITEKEK